MSNSAVPGQNRGQKSRYLNGSASLLVSRAPIEPADGGWSREELLQMDAAFLAAVEAAFRLGLESPASARATQSFQKFLKRVDASSV
jgi:hypothetical protein